MTKDDTASQVAAILAEYRQSFAALMGEMKQVLAEYREALEEEKTEEVRSRLNSYGKS